MPRLCPRPTYSGSLGGGPGHEQLYNSQGKSDIAEIRDHYLKAAGMGGVGTSWHSRVSDSPETQRRHVPARLHLERGPTAPTSFSDTEENKIHSWE